VKAAAQITEAEDDELARLSSRITTLEAEQRGRAERIQLLEEENAWLRARLWGRSSEKSVIELSPDQWQLVFNEAEARAFEAAPEPEVAEIAAHQRAKPGRRKLPANLERVPVIYDLPESEKVCPHDGTTLTVMDREICEYYHFQPARAWITEEVRLTYSCPCCRQHVKTAPGPLKLIPKSIASPELLAHVVTTKVVDAVPLNRQVQQLERYGIPISVATLSNWMLTIGTDRVWPLINLMIELALDAGLMLADETTLQVLQSEKSPTSEHYM
jgi:transposase